MRRHCQRWPEGRPRESRNKRKITLWRQGSKAEGRARSRIFAARTDEEVGRAVAAGRELCDYLSLLTRYAVFPSSTLLVVALRRGDVAADLRPARALRRLAHPQTRSRLPLGAIR